MVDSHPIDGSLASWEDINGACDWTALLLGNGLSMHVSGGFGYGSLFEQAKLGGRYGGLTDKDQALFDALGTQNFERVLAELNAAIRMSTALGYDSKPFYERYTSVQTALADAVRGVHVTRSDVPDETLEAIQDVLVQQQWVFTTSYDLLLYWAMGYDDNYRGLCDCFWGPGNSFDPFDTDVWANATRSISCTARCTSSWRAPGGRGSCAERDFRPCSTSSGNRSTATLRLGRFS